MSTWYEKFEAKVGKDGADKLLLHPIQERIEYVRSKLQLGQNMTDQGPVNYCGYQQWLDTTMTCDERVRFLTGRMKVKILGNRYKTEGAYISFVFRHLRVYDPSTDAS
eukprot:scaffold23291_cov166-Skeletonema_marinoi.AAC.2